MFHPLDIFRTDPDGHVLWPGAVESFAAAMRVSRNWKDLRPVSTSKIK
jgi:hypothetical protein